MSVLLKRIAIIIASVIFVPLFIGYINWDISTITRAGEWTMDERAALAFASIVSIVIGLFLAFTIEDKG